MDLKYFPCSLLAVPTHIPELCRHHSSQENERSLPAQNTVCPGTYRGPPDTNPQQLGSAMNAPALLCMAHSQGSIPDPWHSRNRLQAGARQGKAPNKRSIHWRRHSEDTSSSKIQTMKTRHTPSSQASSLGYRKRSLRQTENSNSETFFSIYIY